MKKTAFLLLTFCGLSLNLFAQGNYANDVKSADAIIAALYEVISGEKGQARDWNRFRNLFIPEGRLIGSGKNAAGETKYRVMTPDDYIATSGKMLVENGFFETEISRKSEQFGPVSHVFSTYESRHSASEKEPFMRGINSIQLFNDGNRWWVVSVYWSAETPENPLPKKYLN